MSGLESQVAAAFSDRYRIDRRLGEGGMAIVYLADDLKHDRQVALKVLRPELAAVLGAERFVAEIRTTASLQHPHILPLFDSGQASADDRSFLYYVMPFVDGETLRQKLDREKQLGLDEAVRIARAVATALDYAHRRDVIHRDIKPENVMLFEGEALVADFGIALAVSQAGGMRITETGLSIGTPHYMSPEQAAADRTLDARTDIYSLGAVTYEMLAGRRPFEAASTPAVMSKILTERVPSARAERPAVPRHVDAAVRVALSKLPADRFASAAQFAEALTNPAFAGPDEAAAAASAAPPPTWRRMLWPALMVGAAAAGWLAGRGGGSPAPGRVVRVQVSLHEGHQLSIPAARARPFDVSADGSRLVYIGETAEGTQLLVRDLGGFEWRALAGTNGALQPFFSPDGVWIGFFARDSLYRVAFAGGAPVGVAPAPGRPYGGAWWGDGRILFASDSGLYRIDAGSAAVQLLADDARLPRRERVWRWPRWPHFLPDGRHALVSTDSGTVVIETETSQARWLFAGHQARYLATGHLIFHAGDDKVRVVPFDLDRLEITGEEVPVLDNVFRGPGSGAAFFAVAARAGNLVHVPGTYDRRLVLVDRTGRETPVPAEPRGYRFPDVSPDGRRVAVTVDPRPSDLWIVDIQRGTAERVQTPQHDGWGVWAPDGRRLTTLGGPRGFGWIAYPLAGGDPVPIQRGEISSISYGGGGVYPKVWAPGDEVLTTGADGDIHGVSVRDGSFRALVATPAWERGPALSPDARWLAFASDATGRSEIYVQGYPEGGDRVSVSSSGGTEPAWARDGSALYYRRGTTIVAVPVRLRPRFEVLGPLVDLFAGPYDFSQEGNWTVTPDGRFLMIKGDPAMTTRLQVVLNWFEELRAPTR